MEKGMSSEYYSQDLNRKAIVFKSDGVWSVDLFENGKWVELRSCHGHAQNYAEDLAENWVNYWGEFNK
jgi:hypothetical protein